MFLVAVDGHSKWLDTHAVTATSLASTIGHLCTCFASHSLPETVVMGNGSVFTSMEFKEFLLTNGIHHSTTVPCHPFTNGLAEACPNFQEGNKRIQQEGKGTLEMKFTHFLFNHQITPHATTGESPAKLLMPAA